MTFKDHFSNQAEIYARARPTYPDGLFAYLANAAPGREAALDVATGNGQAAIALARHFHRVTGIDGSKSQLENAAPADNIAYEHAQADALPLLDNSVDLVTIAQALHWLPLDQFYAEVGRVLKPKGLVAAITYNTPRFEVGEIDQAIDVLYEDILGPYWPGERVHVETAYRDLDFPFTRVDVPVFEMTSNWTLEMLGYYLSSWSATNIYLKETGIDPIGPAMQRLEEAWGKPERKRLVRFPLTVIAGRI